MVNNTVAVQEGHGEKARLRFVVRRGSDGKPVAQITPADGRGWFWLQAGASVDSKLYLILAQIERSGDGVFGFRQVAQWLGIVTNPLDEPDRWRIEQKKLPYSDFSGTRRLSFGAAMMREGEHLFIYGTDEVQRGPGLPNKHMLVAQIKADSFGDFTAWQFYRVGRWVSDFRQAGHLADGMANEFSVSFLPGSNVTSSCTRTGGCQIES